MLFYFLHYCMTLFYFFLLQIGEAKWCISGLGLSVFNKWCSSWYYIGIQKTLKQGNPRSYLAMHFIRFSRTVEDEEVTQHIPLLLTGCFVSNVAILVAWKGFLSCSSLSSLALEHPSPFFLSCSCLPLPDVNYWLHTLHVFCCKYMKQQSYQRLECICYFFV